MSSRILPPSLLLLLSLGLVACDDAAPTATQVVVAVDVDPGVRALTTHLGIDVYGGPTLDALVLQEHRDVVYATGTLPTYLVLAPQGGDPSRVFRVEATARDSSDLPLASATLASGYLKSKVLYASLRIEDGCLAVSCSTAAQTCRSGTCASTWVDPATLPVVADPAHFFDGGIPDAGRPEGGISDGGNPDSGTPDGGSGCVTVDLPDDAFVDTNCDGIDGNVADLVFVAATGNDTTGSGTMGAPYRTIGKALTVAQGAGKTGVAVSSGTYAERVVLVDGISIYGGYDATSSWSRSFANVCTISQSPSDVRSDNGTSYVEAVFASVIHSRTVVDGFQIRVGDAATAPSQSGTNLYGVRIVDSMATGAAGVQLRNLDVITYKASAGVAGTPGGKGEDGAPGGNASGITGGMGGVATCGADGVRSETRGGAGGNGGYDSVLGCNLPAMTSPQNGQPPSGNPSCSQPAAGLNSDCTHPVDGTNDGTHGYFTACGPIISGTCAAAVPALATAARVDSASGVHLATSSGNVGSRGQHGMGGPGGGGSGALDRSGSLYGLEGGGGGGGQSGACGGYPGGGGQGGGASVALLVIRSGGVGVAAAHFTSGQGGQGGAGANGGGGGSISTVGNGVMGPAGTTGGSGGTGRDGQPGANGGGGAGGASVAQLVCSSTVTGLSASTGTAGTAGGGGAGADRCAGNNTAPSGPTGTSSAYVTNCSL